MSSALRQAGSWEELIDRVEEIGFLPLFEGPAAGFSAEALTARQPWWSGDPDRDPWFWREAIARSGRVAYGKFFAGKAGFLSLAWLPVFANWRREGYDFDARWDDGLARLRDKKLMDCFARTPEWTGAELKRAAGFGPGGEKNFEGAVTGLQMRTYLVIRDFRQKVNRRGESYGLPATGYAAPESVWGYEAVTAAYREDPAACRARVYARARELFPRAREEELRRLLG